MVTRCDTDMVTRCGTDMVTRCDTDMVTRCDTDTVRISTVCLVGFSLHFMFSCMTLGCYNHEQLSKPSVPGVLLALTRLGNNIKL
jgi:hypothetical protein